MALKIIPRSLYFLCALFTLASCGANPQTTNSPLSQHQVPPAQVSAQHNAFKKWLADFKKEALVSGISQPVIDNAFANVIAPSDEVMKRDQTQPEKTIVFKTYIKGFLTDKRLNAAHDQWESHAALLRKVQEQYGVPAAILLALWQTESRFGENQGSTNIIQALSTLAFDGRRSDFFRKELMNALHILQEEHIDAATLTGSWAGAMGQVQFMPSSYLAFAVDFDGDGKKDIWNSDADAVASMANYLHTRGWDSHYGWGMHVSVPESSDAPGWAQSKEKHTFREWQRLGVRRADGKRLPKQIYETRLVMPDNDPDNAYLVTSNYDVIMDWNRSIYFATAVGLLADAIAEQQ